MAIINIANLSRLSSTRRIDAEFFLPEGMKAIEVVDSFPRVTKLGKLVSWITQGPNPKFVQKGIPSLNGKNIYFGTAKAAEPNFVSLEEFNTLQSYALKQNDIVITLKHATKIGRSWIIMEDAPKIFSRNLGLIRLKTDSLINPATLLFYLWSDHAQKILDRLATGGTSGQITLATSSLRTLPIPIFRKTLQQEFENYLREYQKMILESEIKYKQAENLLLEEMGLKDLKLRYTLSYTANLSKIYCIHRIDAEYFQPAYDEVIKKVLNCLNGYTLLLSYVKNIKPEYDPTKHPDKTFSYVELADIDTSIGIIHNVSKTHGEEAPSRARRILKKNDVIVSSVEGSLDKVALVGNEYEGALASTGFFQFRSHKILPEVLLVLSKSIVLQSQLKKECTGTILTAVPNEALKRILIPILPNKTQQKIASLVQQCHEERRKAIELLERAKRKAEEAIENRKL